MPRGKRSVAGRLLAHADLTPTHSVEFWEVKPGSVAMVQLIKPGGTEQTLDLGPMLREAGGTYAGLYRKLLKDPNAKLSPELVAADVRRSHLPIRDASLPLPKPAEPPHTPRTHGTPVTVPHASPDPGALRAQSLSYSPVDTYDDSGIVNFDCDGPEVDGGWCPPGAYYNFINGDADEVIYYDVAGFNPQPWPSDDGYENDDDFYVIERDAANPDAGWISDLDWDLWPGETLRVTFVGAPAQYFSEVDGNLVAFADRFRLSFPSESFAFSDPDWDQKGTFSNDIEGIAHAHCPGPVGCDPNLWFFSRTEFVGPLNDRYSGHGQIGISGDLGGVAYGCTFDEPGFNSGPYSPPALNWYGSGGYAHYGDLVYEPNTTRGGNQGYLIVSLNADDNTEAGLGFLGVLPTPSAQCKYTLQNWGAVNVSPSEQAPCVAKTNRYLNHYVGGTHFETIDDAHVYIPASYAWNQLHEYLIDISATPTVVWSQDINIVNTAGALTAVSNPNGMKVSSHGKLYVWGVANPSNVGRLYGIDPFSGIIQTEYDLNYGSPGVAWHGIESEGMDIIQADDVNTVRTPFQPPGFLVQILADSPDESLYNSRWSGALINVSDASRL